MVNDRPLTNVRCWTTKMFEMNSIYYVTSKDPNTGHVSISLFAYYSLVNVNHWNWTFSLRCTVISRLCSNHNVMPITLLLKIVSLYYTQNKFLSLYPFAWAFLSGRIKQDKHSHRFYHSFSSTVTLRKQ